MTNDVPFGGTVHDAARVLRSLAAVFLVLAVVNAILAVYDAVSWPVILTVGFTVLALHLERRLTHQARVDLAGRQHKTTTAQGEGEEPMTLAPEGDLVITVAHIGDGVLVTVSGDLDADTAPLLRWQLDQIGPEPGVVALDMTSVTFCDSVGLSCIVEVIHRGADLRLIGSSRVLRLLTLAGIDHRVRLAASVAEALQPDAR